MKLFPLLFLIAFSPSLVSASDIKIHQIMRETTQNKVRDYATRNFGRDKYQQASSVVVPEKSSRKMLEKLRGALPLGFIAYIGSTTDLSDNVVIGHEIVVIESEDQFDVLRVAQSDGINHDLTNALIIEKLQKWDQLYGIDIWQAETDTIQFTFKSRPKNSEKFAREFYAFCPDLVDQGVGTLGELQKYLAVSNEILLWWD